MDKTEKPKLFFQWVKGELAPNIEEKVKEIKLGNDTYFVFKSGAQVNTKLIGDYVLELENENSPIIDIADFHKQQNVSQQNVNEHVTNANNKNLGNAEVIPHPDDLQGMAEWKRKHSNNQSNNQIGQTKFKKEIKKDPIIELLDKAKKEDVSLTLNLTVQLPSSSFLQILQSTFDDKEKIILDYLLKLVKNKKFDEDIKEFLKKQLKE
jgi:hypothetical protein